MKCRTCKHFDRDNMEDIEKNDGLKIALCLSKVSPQSGGPVHDEHGCDDWEPIDKDKMPPKPQDDPHENR